MKTVGQNKLGRNGPLYKLYPSAPSLIKDEYCSFIYKFLIIDTFLAHLPKDHVRFCHCLASVVFHKLFIIKSFPLKPLNQIKPNFAGMVTFKIVLDTSALHAGWWLLLKIDILLIVNCCFILSQNELTIYLQLHEKEQFNIY